VILTDQQWKILDPGILEALATDLRMQGLIKIEEAFHRWELCTIEKREAAFAPTWNGATWGCNFGIAFVAANRV
jgi:hypothetical protein